MSGGGVWRAGGGRGGGMGEREGWGMMPVMVCVKRTWGIMSVVAMGQSVSVVLLRRRARYVEDRA